MGLIDMVGAERVAIADDIEQLDAASAATPSLCDAWNVHQVAAHLISPFEIRVPAMLKALVTKRFDFDRANADFAVRIAAARDLASIATTLRDNRYHPFTPPGLGLVAPLTDAVVHGQDIRRPLGLVRDFESATLEAVLGFLTSGKARGFVPRSRVAGLTFDAPDIGWRGGEGAAVVGPAETLIMAVAGRAIDLDGLEGPGLATFRSRLGR